ncbi:MAG: cupin domain-containing protein [Thermodesulfobacteriota bacterium]|jgi:quercetin dioxygenase-like cupin family protein
MTPKKMQSGVVRPDRITFEKLDIDILAGHGRDPFTVMRMTVPPDHGVPSHQSPDEDKLFLVLVGSLRFHVGDEFFDVGAGEQIAVAKGDTHGFVNVGTTTAVHLTVTSPARHDELLTALSRLPNPHAPGALDEICRVYNQKLVGEPRRDPLA